MPEYFDDNFGRWEGMDDPDMVEVYHRVQRENVEKTCVICKRKVMLRPEYDKCDSCCTALENGLDPY